MELGAESLGQLADSIVDTSSATLPMAAPSAAAANGAPACCVFPPIFIPSKGRWMNMKGTVAVLIASGIDLTLVVEPQEVHLYQELVKAVVAATSIAHVTTPVVVALPASNQGVSYVRNYILSELAPQEGWFWIMDDDIQGFFRACNRVNVPISAKEVIQECMTRMLQHPEAAIFSIDYPFYAWQYDDSAVALNSYNNIAVMMNRALLPPDIRYRFRIREDYDFTLQTILGGKMTVRFRNLSYKVPKMAAAPGGMTEYYEKQKADIEAQNKEFLATWPSVAREVIKGTGDAERLDINVKWLLLHPLRCADPVAVLRSTERLNVASTSTRQSKPAQKKASSAATRTRRSSRVVHRKRLRASSDTDDASESEGVVSSDGSTEGDDDDDNIVSVKRPPRPPRQPAPPREKVAPGWKGFTIEKYRDPSTEVVAAAGLERVPDHDVKVGHVLLVIPYALDLPSIVPACILEVTRYPPPKHWQWTAVIEKMRGAPIQTVSHCYRFTPSDDMPELSHAVAYIDEAMSAVSCAAGEANHTALLQVDGASVADIETSGARNEDDGTHTTTTTDGR